jgi:zinc protease
MFKKSLCSLLFATGALLTFAPSHITFGETAASPQKKTSGVTIQHWNLTNGAAVYYVYLPQLPIVDVAATFDAGSARDDDSFGIARFTNNSFSQGTGNLSTDAIAEALASLGAKIDNSSDRDMSTLRLRSLSKPTLLNPTVDLFSRLITAPTLPAKSYNRIKNQSLLKIKQKEETPSSIASVAFFNKIYGDTPYAHDSLGTVASLQQLTPKKIADFYHRYYVGSNATLVITGDVTLEQAKAIADKTVGSLPAGTKPAALVMTLPESKQSLTQIPFPSPQTAIALGEIGIERANPDYFPLSVGNYILGGGPLTSRLFMAVRQERGLTYSVGSDFIPMQGKGPFIISLQTKNQDRNEALQVINQVLSDYVTKGPTAQELTAAKKHLIGNFPVNLDSNAAITTVVTRIAFYHLPLDYLDTYRDNINNVTLEQVKQAFATHVQPLALTTVTVGPNPALDHDKKI